MTLSLLAKIALGGYVLYGIAFYGEGYKARGSVGLKTIGYAAESLILSTLVWAAWF